MHEGVATEITKLAAAARIEQLDGRNYAFTRTEHGGTKVELLKAPTVAALTVISLAGIATLASAGFEGVSPETHYIHVADEQTVHIVSETSNKDAVREIPATAKAITSTVNFKFGEFYGQEDFIIKLQAFFVPGFDRDYVLEKIASLAQQDKLQVEDNGLTQGVTVQANVAFASTTTLKPRVTLAPYRTFRDVSQPASDFILRVRKDERTGAPGIALFEADGGEWKLEAIEKVRVFLATALNSVTDTTQVSAESATKPWVIVA